MRVVLPIYLTWPMLFCAARFNNPMSSNATRAPKGRRAPGKDINGQTARQLLLERRCAVMAANCQSAFGKEWTRADFHGQS